MSGVMSNTWPTLQHVYLKHSPLFNKDFSILKLKTSEMDSLSGTYSKLCVIKAVQAFVLFYEWNAFPPAPHVSYSRLPAET